MIGSYFRVALRLAPIATIASLVLFASPVRAQYTYQLDDWTAAQGGFLVSVGQPADILIANSFTVVPGAQTLTSIKFLVGTDFGIDFPAVVDQTVTAAIYTGSSLTDPQAGSGLQRIVAATNTVTVAIPGFRDPNGPQFATIPLATPVTLPVGQTFYAALLLPNVDGEEYPFAIDVAPFLGRSFEDAEYPYTISLDDTSNLGDSAGYPPGNIVLRVGTVPEPGVYGLVVGLGATGLGLLTRRRRRR